MQHLTLHPACKLFPALNDAKLKELADDIKANGLQNPIVLIGNQILDGRNRYWACKRAKVEPQFIEFDGHDPIQWVISQNLIRRHLTSSQKAVVAFDLLPLLEKQAKERMRLSRGRGKKGAKKRPPYSINGKASEVAATIAKTNSTYVETVKMISQLAPELLDDIRTGELKVAEAKALAGLPSCRRAKVLRQAKETGLKRNINMLIRKAELEAKRSATKRTGSKGKTVTKIGDIQIWCGDCLELIREKIKPNTVDVVATSPPFNIGVKYFLYEDNRPEDEYLEWLAEVFQEIERVLKVDGSFFLNVGNTPTKRWNAMKIAQVASRYFELQNEIIWVKSITVHGKTNGHFKPIAGKRFLHHTWESIYHFTKSGNVQLDRLAIGVAYANQSNPVRFKADHDLRCGGDVWYVPYQTIHDNSENGFHPAVWPSQIPERCIKLHGIEKDTLFLDPFCGVNSMIAPANLGVRGIGIDVDPVYCQTARNRVKLCDKVSGG